MSFFPKTYITKTDKPIIIRQAISEDAEKLLKLKLGYIKDTKTLPLFEDEYPKDRYQERALIEKYQSENNSIILVAISEDVIIGNIDLTGSWRKKVKHTAVIGMGIHPKWQNQGVGSLLLQNIIDWAKDHEFLRIIWLEVYASNSSGIALYKKMKFDQSGIISDFFFENGKYIDKITMSRDVSKIQITEK